MSIWFQVLLPDRRTTLGVVLIIFSLVITVGNFLVLYYAARYVFLYSSRSNAVSYLKGALLTHALLTLVILVGLLQNYWGIAYFTAASAGSLLFLWQTSDRRHTGQASHTSRVYAPEDDPDWANYNARKE